MINTNTAIAQHTRNEYISLITANYLALGLDYFPHEIHNSIIVGTYSIATNFS